MANFCLRLPLFVVFALSVSCSTPLAGTAAECESGETQPCGPEPVGACDGAVMPTFHVDHDGDGFGSSIAGAETRRACEKPVGFAASNTDCDDTSLSINPSALEVCDPANLDEDCDGMANEGCDCSTVGMSQACCAGRGMQTCEARDSGASLSVCSVVASLEVCNGVDDDCDGQIDEASPSLCPATGQSCNAGSCACPGGQSLCGTSCQLLGGACTSGTGACARQGAVICTDGAAECSAAEGTPTDEACDGIDNDCDGTIDEGVTLTCYPDRDNDLWAASATASQHCPDPARAAFGSCPVGLVSPSASAGIDCDALNSSFYRLVSTRADADDDSYCAGSTTTLCVGGTAPAGRRFTSNCMGTDDCNDSSASLFLNYTVRTDSDNDGYCVGAAFTQCAGNGTLAGTRLQSTCEAGNDCRDTNSSATVVCMLSGAFRTASATKQCGIGYPGTSVYVPGATSLCPPGFRLDFVKGNFTGGDSGGLCAANSVVDPSLSMTCHNLVFGSFSCNIVGDCVAN